MRCAVSYTGTRPYGPQISVSDGCAAPQQVVMLFDGNARLHTLAFDLDAKTVPSELIAPSPSNLPCYCAPAGCPHGLMNPPRVAVTSTRGCHAVAAVEVRTNACPAARLARWTSLPCRMLPVLFAPAALHTPKVAISEPSPGEASPRGRHPGTRRLGALKLVILRYRNPQVSITTTNPKPSSTCAAPHRRVGGKRRHHGPPGLRVAQPHTRIAVAGAAARSGWTLTDFQRAVRHRWAWMRGSYLAKHRNRCSRGVRLFSAIKCTHLPEFCP
jgi:hypothetical protein